MSHVEVVERKKRLMFFGRTSNATTPSRAHPNRKAHNWLIYECMDRSLRENAQHLKGRVYDLGAGGGSYRAWCLAHAEDYVAVDWPGSLHHGSINIEADLNRELPIENCVADTIICFSVLEHLYSPKVMLSEAKRILSPGGYMLLQVPWQWWIHEAPHDYFRYTPYGLTSLLTDAGFEIINIEPQGGFFTTIVLKLNYFSLRLAKGPALSRLVIKAVLSLGWCTGQLIAPLLDKFDLHRDLECPSYFALARRPERDEIRPPGAE